MIEYRVRPITRYIVTRFERVNEEFDLDSTGCEGKGEYDNEEVAYQVAYALCKAEHDAAGTPPGDENFQYPRRRSETAVSIETQSGKTGQ